MAYFFFDGRDSQQELQLYHQLIRALIIQLADHCRAEIPLVLMDLYKQYGKGHQDPPYNNLQEILQLILKGIFPFQAYIVIDTLDECTEQEKTLKWIKETVLLKAENLHLLVTSRPLSGITTVLKNLDCYHMDMSMSSNVDITAYIAQHIGPDSKLGKWNEKTRKNIQLVLSRDAYGMYTIFFTTWQLTKILKSFIGFDGLHYSLLNWRLVPVW